MASIHWLVGTSGTWDSGADWSGGGVPTGQDTVAIAAAGSYTVTIDGAAAAMAITLKAGEATLQDNGDLTLGGALNVAAGTFVLGDGGSVSGGTIIGGKAGSVQLDAGTLVAATLAGTIALDGDVAVSNGLILDKAILNTSSGFLTTSDQAFMLDDGTINIEAGSGSYGGGIESYSNGGSVILGPHLTVNEYTDGDIFAHGYLANYGTVNAISSIEYSLLASATVFNAGSISANGASATQWLVASAQFQNNGLIIASHSGSILVEGEGDASVANDGTIVADSGANITLTGASVDNTGVLKIAGGTLTVPASNAATTTVFDDSGATYITSGSLVLQAATQLGGKFAIFPGGVLLVDGATSGGTISNRGAVEITSAGMLTNTVISGGTLIGEVDSQDNSGDLSNVTLNDTTVRIAGGGSDGFLYFSTASNLNNVTFDIGTSNAQQVRFEDVETISTGEINLNGNGSLDSTSSLTLTGKVGVVVSGTENMLQATYFTDAVNIAVSGAGNELEFLGYQITQDATLAASQGGSILVQGHDLTNNGTFAASSGGSIEFVSTSLSNAGLVLADDGLVYVDRGSVDDFSNDGTFAATNGGTIELGNNERNGQPGGGGTITNLAGGVLSGGTWLVSGASQLDLSDNATLTTLAAMVILSGSGAAFGALDYAPGGGPGTFTSIETQLTDIATKGVLELQNGRDFSTANALTDDGHVLLAGGTLSAAAGLTLSATGTVSGAGVISGAFTDNGVVAAARGTLVLTGAASGQGALSIGAGATLKLATDTSVGVTFAGAGGTLTLATNTLTAAVTGYAGDETIDLRHAIVTAAGSSGDSLTLTTESGQIVINLAAPLVPGTGFMLTPDGFGGTDVTAVSPGAEIISDSFPRFIFGDGRAGGATQGVERLLDGHRPGSGIIAGDEKEFAATITDWAAASALEVAKLPAGRGVFHASVVTGDGGSHFGFITLHQAGGGFSIADTQAHGAALFPWS